MMKRTLRSTLLAAASTAILAPVAGAQVFDPVGGEERRQIETITVTAQQREESVQDVPLSIGAYDTDALENAGVRDIKDLISIAPGLMVTSTQAETITTARIRGIGTVGDNFGLESSVGVYIDGVFRARNGVGFGDLGELERIEVLRGPQGTLFGKNTSAGVLNIITAAPSNEHSGFGSVTLGDYGLERLEGGLNIPASDTLAFRLYGAQQERKGFTNLVVQDGSGTSIQDSETQDYYTFRGQALWTPSDLVEGRIIVDYSERDEFCCSAVAWDYTAAAAGLVGAVGGLVGFPADPEARVANANRPFVQSIKDSGISAEFDFETPFGELTSVTAFRTWKNSRSQDIDYSGADIAYRDQANNFTDLERFSQELRLTGVNGNLDWLVGAFYSYESLNLGDAIRFGDDWEIFLGLAASGGTDPFFVSNTLNAVAMGPLFAPGSALPGGSGVNQDLYSQDTVSFAVFTHNTYDLTDNLSVTGGLRYTREEKDVFATFSTNATPGCAFFESVFGPNPAVGAAGTPVAGLVPLVCLPYARTGLDANGYDRERSDEEFSGTLRLSYTTDAGNLLFAGYSRGFKSGGFNLDRQLNGPTDATGFTNADSSFAPEIVDALEAGFKSQLFGDVLQLNGTVFFQQIDDFQLNTFNGLAFVVESIEESESRGAEIDFLYLTPIEGLDIAGGYAYVDTEYSSVNTGDPLVDALEGQSFSLSPEHFLNASVTYRRPVGLNHFFLASIDGRYVTEYNTGSDLDPEKEQEAFGLLNARLGIGREDGKWSVEVWGRNLTDETYAQVAFDAFAQGSRAAPGTSLAPRGTASYMAFLGAPSTWGVTLRTEW
ncbi:MAG: TonB-dependent receptor [Pseudomonadota bacterium]